jgi:hypothetical protein
LGLPIAPGCLLDFLGGGAKHARHAPDHPDRRPDRSGRSVAPPHADKPLPPAVSDILRDLSDRIRKPIDRLGLGDRPRHGDSSRDGGALRDLLDFVLGP